MKKFFGEDVLLSGRTAKKIYGKIKDLPVVDYHCHLSPREIAADRSFSDIGELWLAADHYKWRAMRLCGVEERLITGDATYREKFRAFAGIFPKLFGNPLYYFCQMELKAVFGIKTPLSSETADEIFDRTAEICKNSKVSDLLRAFRVEYIATTDDPADDLGFHAEIRRRGAAAKEAPANGAAANALPAVAPTFRPDRALTFDGAYLQELGRAAGVEIRSLSDLKTALSERLEFFLSAGCRISDHGMDFFPAEIAEEDEAAALFLKPDRTAKETDRLRGNLLLFLAKEYAARGVGMQLHLNTLRNVNRSLFAAVGADGGIDIMNDAQSVLPLVRFFDRLSAENALPKTVVYTLNPESYAQYITACGAFPKVRFGTSWWFNDAREATLSLFEKLQEYGAFGTFLGMLTDSRSFTSYVRFDFFRRLLADEIARKVDAGEYPLSAAEQLAKDIAYGNAKEFFGL